ncbi:MAG: hypothetical protein CME07_06625 [Gemmatimonadetes bacterium]|jgi:hypothetical protein|nr:hypothetical protein [Gemmatimonadota bacterium]
MAYVAGYLRLFIARSECVPPRCGPPFVREENRRVMFGQNAGLLPTTARCEHEKPSLRAGLRVFPLENGMSESVESEQSHSSVFLS